MRHHRFVENSPFADVHIPSLALPALQKYTEEVQLCTSYVSPLRRWECLPAIAFLLHCITRLLECCFVHKFRCAEERAGNRGGDDDQNNVDSVTLFATLAGCSFYIFASLSTCFVLLPLLRESEVMSSMHNQLYYTPTTKFRLLPETNLSIKNKNTEYNRTTVVNVSSNNYHNISITNDNNIKHNKESSNSLFTFTIDEREHSFAHRIAYFSSWLNAARSSSTRDVYRVDANTTITHLNNNNNSSNSNNSNVRYQNALQVKFTLAESELTDKVNHTKEIFDIIALREPWNTLRCLLSLLPEWFTVVAVLALFVWHITLQTLQVAHHSVLASLRSSQAHSQSSEYNRHANLQMLKWAERKLQHHTKAALAVRAHDDQNDARWMRRRRTALTPSSYCNESNVKQSCMTLNDADRSDNTHKSDCGFKVQNNINGGSERKSTISSLSSSQSPSASSLRQRESCTGVDKRIFSYHFPSTRLLFQYVLEPHYTLEVLMYFTNACIMWIFIFYGICLAPGAIEQTKFDPLLPNVFVTSSTTRVFREYTISRKFMIVITLQLFPAFAVALFSFCNLAITANEHRHFWLYVNEERDVSRVLLSTDLECLSRGEDIKDYECNNQANNLLYSNECARKAQMNYQRSILSVLEKEDIPDWNLLPGLY